MSDIRLGIVGTNFVSDWLCDSTHDVAGVTALAVCSRTAEKGGEFAAKHGIPAVYHDYEEFLRSEIDAVYIAVPNIFHYRYALAALNAGKHVLLEKPAALDEAHFVALEEAADRSGVVLLEAMRPGHDPAVAAVKDAMREIGTVRRAVFDFCQYSSRYDKFKSGEVLNAFNPAYGNAAVMDIGCYALHVCLMILGEPDAVEAKSVILHNGFEGMGTVFLTYGGMQAEVVYSKITGSLAPSVITGEDGWITMQKLSTMEEAKLITRGGVTPGGGSRPAGERLLTPERPSCNMVFELEDFVSCIRGGLSAAPFRGNTRMTMRVIDEIRRQNGIVFPPEE